MTVARVPGQTLTWVNHQNIVKQISHEVLLIILFFKSVFFSNQSATYIEIYISIQWNSLWPFSLKNNCFKKSYSQNLIEYLSSTLWKDSKNHWWSIKEVPRLQLYGFEHLWRVATIIQEFDWLFKAVLLWRTALKLVWHTLTLHCFDKGDKSSCTLLSFLYLGNQSDFRGLFT